MTTMGERVTTKNFKLARVITLDVAKRNLRTLVVELDKRGGEVTIGKTESRPSLLIYAAREAGDRGDDLSVAHRTTVAEFVAKSTSWLTVLRYEGGPVVIEAGGRAR